MLTESLTVEAALTEFGEVVAQADLVGSLTRRLQVVEHRRTHPELAELPIERPIFIVGQVRTGTTILFELLAQDPAARAPLTWEVDAPCPPPEAATYDTDPRIEDSRQIQEMMTSIIPDLKSMHPIGPLLAQECVRITAMDLRSFIFPTIYHVPTYAQWLLGTDMASAYRWHRGFLQHLQSRIPVNRWVLKSPGHIWALDAMMKEYPDALVIQTHRDPLRIIASVSSLTSHAAHVRQRGDAHRVGRRRVGRVRHRRHRPVRRRARVRDHPSRSDRRRAVPTFAADPITTIAAAYDQLGLSFTANAESKMRDFLADQPAREHGGHHYTFADTGLGRERISRTDGPLPGVLQRRRRGTRMTTHRIVSMTTTRVVQHQRAGRRSHRGRSPRVIRRRRRWCSCTAAGRPAAPGLGPPLRWPKRGWQAVTVDFRGHGESDWSDDGDYRVTTFAADVIEVLRQLPPRPVLVGASLGGLTSMLLAGELAPGTARAVVLVDIVPNMNPAGRRGSTSS